MQREARDLKNLEWVGGNPALDFVNTVHTWRGNEPGEEYISDFNALLEWNRQAGLIESAAVLALRSSSEHAQQLAMRAAVKFRGTLHSIFQCLAHEEPLRQLSLDELIAVVRKSMQCWRLCSSGTTVKWRWEFAGASPSAILGPVAWSAIDLLQHGPVERIKECPGPEGCGWLFLDLSKNRSRTWCSMRTCGNAAKVRRFRARQ